MWLFCLVLWNLLGFRNFLGKKQSHQQWELFYHLGCLQGQKILPKLILGFKKKKELGTITEKNQRHGQLQGNMAQGSDTVTKSQFPSMMASFSASSPFKGTSSHSTFTLHFLTFKSNEKEREYISQNWPKSPLPYESRTIRTIAVSYFAPLMNFRTHSDITEAQFFLCYNIEISSINKIWFRTGKQVIMKKLTK